ncbi:Dimethylmenaquinone methyltransferase [Vibrio chagasii]|uniref:RraA family protein n=1 Tax=Vibrio TaxID=662 RepID=UPI0022CDA75A|nr:MULTISPECIES: RraA family protein [unclassified Vibrio]MDA0151646.1 RraA family protein [Vibrio sp. Makdt]CAH7375638.1 Dimethylmenaquinone methyltransferase [Vibrio chagasii]
MLTLKELEIKERLNRIDTASVCDALDSLSLVGGLQGIKPRTPGTIMAGPVYTVQYAPIERDTATFLNAGNYIDEVPEGYVVLVDNQGRLDCTSWGGILTSKAQRKNIAGTVIYGSGRDIREIQNANYPLFSTGIYMVSGKNRAIVAHRQVCIEIHGVSIYPGDWLFGDDNGVVVIPKDQLEETLYRAENTEQTEKKILDAINSGETLEAARAQYSYSTPWEVSKE